MVAFCIGTGHYSIGSYTHFGHSLHGVGVISIGAIVTGEPMESDKLLDSEANVGGAPWPEMIWG